MTHPARFSKEIIDFFRDRLTPEDHVHDPFAGTGERLGALADEIGFRFTGTEIEDCFVVDPRVRTGDSRSPQTYLWGGLLVTPPFVVLTSPVYANGMTDNFVPSGVCSACRGSGDERHGVNRSLITGRPCPKCGGTGKREVKRRFYRLAKIQITGDPEARLVEGNAAAHGYRQGKKAAARYWDINNAVVAQWRPAGAVKAYVNVKDFLMTRKKGEPPEVVPHVDEWVDCLIRHGWWIKGVHDVTTPGMRYGENRKARVDHEMIIECEPK